MILTDLGNGYALAESSITPADYFLPHGSWRKYQLESVLWAHSIGEEGNPPIGIMEASTGSGKSAVAVAQSVKGRTIIVTRTKALQDAYEGYYHVASLKGKSNYPCVYDPKSTCEECAFEKYHFCPKYSKCAYVAAKYKAMSAKVAVVNYALWLSDRRLRESDVDLVVLDECHLLRGITMDWSGLTIDEHTRVDWQLPRFPDIRMVTEQSFVDAIAWIDEAARTVQTIGGTLRELVKQGSEHHKKRLSQCENLWRKLDNTKEALYAIPIRDAWYIESGRGTLWRGLPVPGIIVRPLTAKFHFRHLFGGESKYLLMSATIGDIPSFAETLGIPVCMSRVVPNQFEPWQRPILILDAPRMSHKNSRDEVILGKQADAIAEAILSSPGDWPGIIHVTRKDEAPKLRHRLLERGVSPQRLWVPPQKDGDKWLGTGEQAALWDDYLNHHPNAIVISWQFWEGYDGLREKICIAAKIPFGNIGSAYEKAQFKYDPTAYQLEAACLLQQSLGRSRRGRPEDYDDKLEDGTIERRGLVAVADGNLSRIKKKLSPDISEALVY